MADSVAQANGNSSDSVRESFMELCRELNMDVESQDTAWASYKKIDQNYVLEGEKTHWMACALYIACHQSAASNADKATTVKGNGVSLTSLLRKTNLRLDYFFQKIRRWLDMTKLGSNFRERIDLLEKKFHVSSIVYKKTESQFYEIFKSSDGSGARSSKGRLRKKQACSANELFNFTWTLYVRAKVNFPTMCDDLVESFHLLLCCIDLMFLNALMSKSRRELLNPTFKGLPEDYMTKDFNEDDLPSAIEELCLKHDGNPKDPKEIREHYWKPFIRQLIEREVLKGNPDTLTGFLDASNFEYNWKHLHQDYDEHVLSSGEIDERIFLGDDASPEIGTPLKGNQPHDFVDEYSRSHLRRSLHFDKSSVAPLTPLTGRRYLKDKESIVVTPITNANQSVSRLQNHLRGHKAAASEGLATMFAECQTNPQKALDETISNLGELFQAAYVQPSIHRPQSPCSTMEFANNRWKLSLVLFYKILENILKTEKKISPSVDISSIVSQELFVKTLMACCIEIVLCSYNSQKTFPWVLRPFELSPFHFYKIIEVVMREEGLSRAVVKHLNMIEESILDRLAWEEHSPLYDALHNAGDIVPSCESVCFAPCAHGDTSAGTHVSVSALSSPVLHRNIYKIAGDKVIGYPVQQSPTAIPITDRFSASPHGNVKRSLFNSGPTSTSASSGSPTPITASTTITMSPDKPTIFGTLSMSGKFMQQASKGGGAKFTVVLPVMPSPTPSPSQSPAKRPDASPLVKREFKAASPAKQTKKINSLGLFFRKVYHLASVRLSDLTAKLSISSELHRKIWTCFEHALIKKLPLMKDRHLDQMLMCAIYVMAKVTKEDRTFQDIMKCYRQQPQANSEVYRHVLISRGATPRTEHASSKNDGHPSTPSKGEPKQEELKLTPTRSTRSSTKASREDHSSIAERSSVDSPSRAKATELEKNNEFQDRYGDLIEFYNAVFVKEIKDFALKFSKPQNDAPHLSPLPVRRRQPASPRRVSSRHEIYVSPVKDVATTPGSRLLYCFDESPAGRLLDINKMVRGSAPCSSRRRISDLEADEDSGPSPTKKLFDKKLQALKPEKNHR